MSSNKEIIKKLLLKAERCTDVQMHKAIQKKIEILKDNQTVTK